ncbi:hypothetical protein ACOMHN_048578 [Nucella lapillus]
MPSDPKGYGKRRKRRRFCGNQHKKAKTDCRESENECEVSVESVEEDFLHVDPSIDSQPGYSGSKRSTSATPTRSEIKLFKSCSTQWEDVVLPLRWEVVLTIPERREASRQKTVLRETTRGSAQFVSL